MNSELSTDLTGEQSLDSIFDHLSDRRCRLALRAVAGRDPPIPLREVAAAVASRESGADAATTHEVAIELHHVHLPRLSDGGVLEYDSDRNAVTGVRAAALDDHLAAIDAVR